MKTVLLLAASAALAACAPQPKYPTTPTQYVCSGFTVTRTGSELKISDTGSFGRLSWSDSAGSHYVVWPISPTDRNAIEFVMPEDPRSDAKEKTYDTTYGSSVSDWRLKATRTCTASDGYSDVLARYVKGESIDDLTRSLALDSRDETRELLHRAMQSLHKRYYKDL